MVPLGIITFTLAVHSAFQAFDWLERYTSMVLALIAGTIIFFLFLGDDFFPNPLGEFNDLLLESTLATFQTDLTSLVSIVILQYFFIAGVSLGLITIFISLVNLRSVSLEGNPTTLIYLAVLALGIVIIIISSLFILFNGHTGLAYYFIPSDFFKRRMEFYMILIIVSLSFVLSIAFFMLIVSNKDHLKPILYDRLQKTSLSLVVFILVLLIILFGFGVILGLAPGFDQGGSSRVIFPPGSATSEVWINEACSGIHSFTIFISCFYVAILYSVREFSKQRLIPALIIGTIGTLSSNWLRIIIILLIGLMDPNLMWEVHNYAGLVIFFSWMFFFWLFALDFLKKSKPDHDIENLS
jgi:exosortase/archaeosortase family protein